MVHRCLGSRIGIELPVGRSPAIDPTITIEPFAARRASTAAVVIDQVPTT